MAREAILIFRTIINAPELAPGWYWWRRLKKEGIGELLLHLVSTDHVESVRIGALNVIRRVGAQLPVRLTPQIVEETMSSADERVRDAVFEYLKTAGDASDREVLERLIAGPNSVLARKASEALIIILARINADEAFTLLLASALRDVDAAIHSLRPRLDSVDTAILRRGLEHAHPGVRGVALSELIRRRTIPAAEVLGVVEGLSDVAKADVYRAMIRAGENVDPAKVRDALRPTAGHTLLTLGAGVDVDDVLMELYSQWPMERLVDRLSWYSVDGPLIYRVLATRHFGRLGSRIRADLTNGFAALKSEAQEKLRREFGIEIENSPSWQLSPELEEFVQRRFAGAALAGLAEHGSQGDDQYARPWLAGPDREAALAAARVIGRFGKPEDTAALIAIAKTAYGELRNVAADVALRLSPETAASAFLEEDNPVLVAKALQVLRDRGVDVTNAALDQCDSERDDVREIAVVTLLETGPEYLEEKLGEYTERPTYYYNVVTWN